MRLELVGRMEEVEQERRRLDSCQEQMEQRNDEAQHLASELAERNAELEASRSEIERLREALKQQQNAADDRASEAELGSELHALEESVRSLRTELDSVRDQRDELLQRAQDDAAWQARMADVESESGETQRQSRAGQAVTMTVPAAELADSSLTINAEQYAALEQERAALEAELELVRNRAAELNETVALQQREIVEQKTELSGDLQQLRRLVEKQADLIADRANDNETSKCSPGESEGGSVETPQPNDPVVNSVMAQFAKLQKDVAQRRRRK